MMYKEVYTQSQLYNALISIIPFCAIQLACSHLPSVHLHVSSRFCNLDFSLLPRLHYYSLRIRIRQRTRHDSLPLSICSPGAGRPLPFAYRCEFRSLLLFSPDTQHILLSLLS